MTNLPHMAKFRQTANSTDMPDPADSGAAPPAAQPPAPISTRPGIPATPAIPPRLDGSQLTNTDIGYLVVYATAAGSALPLENALVSVYSTDESNVSELIYTVRTNKSGRTPQLPLAAPPRSNSLTPGAKDAYANYSVSVDFPSYQPIVSNDISIFSDIVATLPVYLKPIEAVLPQDNLSPPSNSQSNALPAHILYQKE